MSDTLTDDPHHDDLYSADELQQYRSLSTLAVAALLLGTASVLAFAAPMLIAIPLIAIAIAALALSRIHTSEGALTGGLLARVGIVLAIIFGVAAITHGYVRSSLSIRLATDAGQEWLSLMSTGQFDEALNLMSPTAVMRLRPLPTRADLPEPPFDREMASDTLSQEAVVHAIQPAEPSEAVQFRSSDEKFAWIDRDPEVVCSFHATGTHVPEVELHLGLKRMLTSPKDVVWLVDSWSLVEPTAAEIHAHHDQ